MLRGEMPSPDDLKDGSDPGSHQQLVWMTKDPTGAVIKIHREQPDQDGEFKLLSIILSSVGRVLVKCWSSTGQVLVKYWSSVGQILVKY